MSQDTATRTMIRRTLGMVAAGLAVVAVTVLAPRVLGPASQPDVDQQASPTSEGRRPVPSPEMPVSNATEGPLLLAPGAPRDDSRGGAGAITTEDGALPDGVTVFDDEYPGIARLDRHLLRALREAATVAHDMGVEFYVNSGWRSADYQNELRRQAITEYGSAEEAARWVTTAETSEHVSGNAVDLDDAAREWLRERGADYGLCQIYANEPWHYELRPEAIDHGCPEMYPDAAHDPRSQS